MPDHKKDLPIVVIGAGIGGLSAAIHLAASGHPVTLLETNDAVGGKMGQISAQGFRWDTGPSVITMRHVIEELFTAANRSLDDYLTLQPVNPLTRYFYPDGTGLDVTRDLPAMIDQVRALNEHDVEGYLNFLSYAAKIHRITGPVFIYDRPPTLSSFARVPMQEWVQIDPWLTMDQAIRRHIQSPQLRQLLARFATYVGASPFLAPATLSVIAHVELNQGVWYPKGGIYAIATALGQLAQELGVDIRINSTVQQITAKNGAVDGVRLADGAHVAAKAVIANVDVTTVYQHMLPQNVATKLRRQKLTGMPTSSSGFALLWGIDGRSDHLAHHNIFFSDDYRQEFIDIFQRGKPPDNPTIYVAITAKSDPEHAPAGCENWFVLVNAPPTGRQFDWSKQRHAYRDRIVATLASYDIDVESRIQVERMLTPADIGRRTGAWRGALYGISSNQAWNAFRRPHNRCPHLAGLFFAGGTTHPGGGVPMVMLSGRVAAGLTTEYLGHETTMTP